MPLAPGESFAGYRVVRQLGAGGMGAVYLVRHPRLPRLEALKALRPEYSSDADFARRFLLEAELVAGLDHRNIVPVLDRGEDEGRLWLTMRYVDGIDAEEALAAAGGLLPAERAVRIVAEVAAALDCAHRSNLVHRDVKPANVLLSRPVGDEPEQVFLTDFGIARSLDADTRLTRTGMVIATFDYASPEQIESRPLDSRSDVYSLGCVLYRLLTGNVPFPGSSVAAALHGHLALPPPRPTPGAPWLPPGLDAVVVRAMAKDPDDRYPTCGALAADASAALRSHPELPPGPFRLAVTAGGPTRWLSTDELPAAETARVTGLLRQTRFFDLPASLTHHEGTAPAVPARPVTLEVHGGGRVHRVVADLGTAHRPPALDDLVDTVRTLGSASPPARPAAPETVVEMPRVPPPAVHRAPVPVPVPVRNPAPVPAPAPVPVRPAGRRRLVVAGLVAALVAAGGTTWLLTRSDDDPGAGDPANGRGTTDAAAEALAALPSAGALPDGTVLLGRQVDGESELYAVDGDSGAVSAQLTDAPGDDHTPVLLPGRATVVYAHVAGGGEEWRVVATDGSGDRPLFPDGIDDCERPGRPTFDPTDPRRLALVCGSPTGAPSLRLVTLDGAAVSTLYEGEAVLTDPAFSPDGSRVVVAAGDDPGVDGGALLVVDVAEPGAAVRITDGVGDADADPAWSPDGTQLVWRREVGAGARSIVVGSPTTVDDARILTAGSFDQDPVWSPDGATIAYKSDLPGDAAPGGDQLWLMDADGSDPRQLPADEGTVSSAPAWADYR